jgi:dCMP deaminase
MSEGKWDIRFLRMATRDVASWSKDPETQVGCVIVSPDRRQVTFGYNGLPKGVADTSERLGDKKTRNRLSVHAELNAILNSRLDLAGWTLYVTKAPCTQCALAIIQAGVTRVVSPPATQDSSWYECQLEAEELLAEAGIETVWYSEGTY